MLFQKTNDANKNMAASLLSEFEEFYPFAHGEDSKNGRSRRWSQSITLNIGTSGATIKSKR